MGRYEIHGGCPLDGQLEIKSAKNSILPLMAASLLTNETVILKRPPKIVDVANMINILESLGTNIQECEEYIQINAANVISNEIASNLANKLRSSIFLLGALLSRNKQAIVAYPGGCDIGLRPIDIHIQGLKDLNIKIIEQSGKLFCDSSNATASEVVLDLPSVGATENIIMASVLLKGTTIIRNCAKEPEIVDLQNFLNRMGAKICGCGTGCIRIDGVDKLHGVEYEAIPDRIVLGTYLIATAMCGGCIEIENFNTEHIFSLVSKLRKTSCKIYVKNGKMLVKSTGRPKSIERIETLYYPGFPTDLQTQALALQTISDGSSLVVENIFETRFRPVSELIKMGANIVVRGKTALVRGVERLHGSVVSSTDLRGGASLVLAGLCADGITTVENIQHIDRGYEDMAQVLSKLGANIRRID